MSKKIYVGNLSFQTTETEITQAFSGFGPVESVSIHYGSREGPGEEGFSRETLWLSANGIKFAANQKGNRAILNTLSSRLLSWMGAPTAGARQPPQARNLDFSA